jgi:hypothetical protein
MRRTGGQSEGMDDDSAIAPTGSVGVGHCRARRPRPQDHSQGDRARADRAQVAVLVHVQTYVRGGARFTHGPSPREFATTRPTIGPVRWCSSARLARAIYVVAGGGPPEFTKPSCLDREPCQPTAHATGKEALSALPTFLYGDSYAKHSRWMPLRSSPLQIGCCAANDRNLQLQELPAPNRLGVLNPRSGTVARRVRLRAIAHSE